MGLSFASCFHSKDEFKQSHRAHTNARARSPYFSGGTAGGVLNLTDHRTMLLDCFKSGSESWDDTPRLFAATEPAAAMSHSDCQRHLPCWKAAMSFAAANTAQPPSCRASCRGAPTPLHVDSTLLLILAPPSRPLL